MDWPEKIAIYTNPIWYIIVLILVIVFGLTELWNKVIWCNKRWYFNKFDLWMVEREFKKGLTEQQLKNIRFWAEREKKNPNYSKIKLLIEKYENKDYESNRFKTKQSDSL